MINQLAQNQQQFVKKIFSCIQTHKYEIAEREVSTICSKIIHNAQNIKDRSSYLLLIDVLYSEFNDYYAMWMKEHNQEAQLSEDSENIFLEHCADASKMEDLLWETANILTAEKKHFV